jgi:hypothetical protein
MSDVQAGYDAVYRVIGEAKQGVYINGLIWRAVHAFRDALSIPPTAPLSGLAAEAVEADKAHWDQVAFEATESLLIKADEKLAAVVAVCDKYEPMAARNDEVKFGANVVLKAVREALAAPPAEAARQCHNGHPFVDTDMEAEGRTPDPRWCNTCGEADPAEAVEADGAGLPNYDHAASKALTDLLRPTPEQVEAESACEVCGGLLNPEWPADDPCDLLSKEPTS